jgi:hypothetical protein
MDRKMMNSFFFSDFNQVPQNFDTECYDIASEVLLLGKYADQGLAHVELDQSHGDGLEKSDGC